MLLLVVSLLSGVGYVYATSYPQYLDDFITITVDGAGSLESAVGYAWSLVDEVVESLEGAFLYPWSLIGSTAVSLEGAFLAPIAIGTFAYDTHESVFTLTINAVSPYGGGTTDPVPGGYDYLSGAEVTLTATNSTNYHFDHWTIDGGSVTENPTTITMDQNHDVTAYFDYDHYTITASSNPGGYITPTGAVTVDAFQNQTFTITALPGFSVANVTIDGVGMGALSEVTFVAVQDDHTLEVEFEGAGSYLYVVNLRRFENGTTFSSPYVATIILANGTILTPTISADSTNIITTSLFTSFSYPLYSEGYRTLYNPSSPITPLIPVPTTDQDSYLFTINDLTGYLVDKVAYLEAWRTIGSESFLLDSAVVDGTVNGVPLTLERYATVYLKLLLPGNVTRHNFGQFTPTGSPLTHTLIFSYLGFDNTMPHINNYISASAYRLNTTIDVLYANTLTGYDFNATARLYLRNGTLVDMASSTSDSDILEFTGLDSETDYVTTLEVTHDYWVNETIRKSWGFEGYWVPEGSPPAFPDFTSMGWTVGGTSNLIGFGLILFVAGVFSYASAPLGIVFTVLVAGALGAVGIVSIPVDLLALAFSLAIIYSIGRRDK